MQWCRALVDLNPEGRWFDLIWIYKSFFFNSQWTRNDNTSSNLKFGGFFFNFIFYLFRLIFLFFWWCVLNFYFTS